MKKIVLTMILLAALILPGFALPLQINYQGLLNDKNGRPINSAGLPVIFSIYNAATGGTATWTETQTVAIVNGEYSAQLGSINPIGASIFDGTTKYLGIAAGTDPEMSPRVALVAVPYAYRASNADAAASVADHSITQPAIDAGTPSANKFLRWNGSALDWAVPPGGGGSVEVDNLTTSFNTSGSIEVKNLGITTVKLGPNAVTAAKMGNNSVTQPAIAAGAPLSNQFLQWSGSALQWADAPVDNITTDLTSGLIEVKNLGITNGKIANTTITGGKLASNININTTGPVTANTITAEVVRTRTFLSKGTDDGYFVGTGSIPMGANGIPVTNAAVTSSSIILLSIGTGANPFPPGSNCAAIRVSVVNAGVGFNVKTVDGSVAPAGGIPFGYIIIN